MIQDIFPSQFSNAYDANLHPKAESVTFYFQDNKLLVRLVNGRIYFPYWKEFVKKPRYQYLFSINDTTFFLAEEGNLPIPRGYSYYPLRDLRKENRGASHKMFAAFTAQHLRNWYLQNRFCGSCGSVTIHDIKERALRCQACGRVIYPRINPAVIVGVRNGNKILLTKYAHLRCIPYYALIAGFCEIGETIEETARREVMEEVGLQIKNLSYYKSQPWGIADDLLMGFFCDLDGADTIRIDKNELVRAEWVNRENICPQADDFSLTNEMMMCFKAGKDRECRL